MWPFICQFIEKLFRETIEPAVRGAHTHLSTFSFTRVDLGQQVCLLSGFLTCAPLERRLSHFTLLSRASCFLEGWLCAQALPGSPVSGSLLCRDSPPLCAGLPLSVQVHLRAPQPHVLPSQLPLYCPAGDRVSVETH